MGFFHFEREDEIEDMISSNKAIREISVPDDVIEKLAEQARSTGMAAVFLNGNTTVPGVRINTAPTTFYEYRVTFGRAMMALSEEFICSISSGFCHGLYVIRKGLSQDEFLKAACYPSDPEEIKKRLSVPYYARNLKLRIIPREEIFSGIKKIGFIREDGKLGFKKHFNVVYDIAGNKGPYAVAAEYDMEEESPYSSMWWNPIKDGIDKLYFDTKIYRGNLLDGMEMETPPSEEILNQNTAAYTAAMVKKIEDGIRKDGYYDSAKDDEKAVFWRENLLPGEYAMIDWHKIVRRDTEIFKLAALLGCDEKKLSREKQESGVSVEITRSGVKVTNVTSKDYFREVTHGNDEIFWEKAWYTQTTVYAADKAAIMAEFKKRSIDPYEVTKLTTVWHYLNFATAVMETLKLGDVSLYQTELMVLQHYSGVDALYFKKYFQKACDRYFLRDYNFIGILESIKKVAEKLGVPCRDPAATYKAAADHAASRRR